VALDVLATLHRADYLSAVLAHEAFHYHSIRMLPCSLWRGDPEERLLTLLITSIQQEGIADHVACLFMREEELREMFEKHVERGDEYVRGLDRSLSKVYEGHGVDVLVEFMRGVPFGGHVVGYYMAKAIAEALGQEELALTARNPFRFLKKYSEAAEALGLTPLSETSLKLLEAYEVKHFKPSHHSPG